MIYRWHVESPAPRHLGDRLVIHVGRVLDRIGPGPHGVTRAARPVRMNRYSPAYAVRGVNRRLHLLEAESLIAGNILEASAGSVHLDPIGAGFDLLQRHTHYCHFSARLPTAGKN